MGVNGLWAFLKKRCPDAFRDVTTADMQGQRLALDAPMLLTTCLIVTAEDAPESEWIEDFVRLSIRKLQDISASVVVVFDGVAPVEKQHARGKREKNHSNAIAKLKKCRMECADDEETIRRAVRATTRITASQRKLMWRVFDDLGYDVVIAAGEGERCAAEMTQRGLVSGVVTEDGDALVCGATKVFRGICSTSHAAKVVSLDVILDVLRITPRQFQWLAVLSGTDFHPGIYKIGPTKALQLVQAHDGDDKAFVDSLKTDPGVGEGLCAALRQFGRWSSGGGQHAAEDATHCRRGTTIIKRCETTRVDEIVAHRTREYLERHISAEITDVSIDHTIPPTINAFCDCTVCIV